ncbi:MAG: NAD(+)/NADH kinase [Gemmatimonadota bacterium]|nr:NAD(+)/NADH kinase [Gemmatimonadota bacterium]
MKEELSSTEDRKEIQSIGVVAPSRHPKLSDCLRRLMGFALTKGIDLRFEQHLLSNAVEDEILLELDTEPVDLLIALGGDGTLLRAGRLAAERGVPVLGINIGHLGFLTALRHQEMEDRLALVLDGSYVLDRRFMLEAHIVGPDGAHGDRLLAWNDFVIHKRGVARVTRLDLRVREGTDWQEVGSFSGDGLIVSTPTGSTGYSLSAGGPIVVSSVDCVVVTPICPHTLAVRPLVIPGNQLLSVSPLERTEDLVLTADGQIAHEFETGGHVRITRSNVEIPLIRFADQNFFGTLQQKLNWAARPSR